MIGRDMETQLQDDNSKGSTPTKLSPTDKERIAEYWAAATAAAASGDSNNTTPTSDRNELAEHDDNRRRQAAAAAAAAASTAHSKTSFSVDDILSPSKFNGQLHNIAPEYFMQWQPWLMHEMLRHHHHHQQQQQHHHNATFSNVTLSIYKPFLANHLKDGKSCWSIIVSIDYN